MLYSFIAPQGFGRGQNPKRHPRIPRVYTYKDKEEDMSVVGEAFSIWRN